MVAQLVTCTATLQNVVMCNQPDSCTDGDVLTREQMRLVLQLAVALWGDLPTDCDPGRPCSYRKMFSYGIGIQCPHDHPGIATNLLPMSQCPLPEILLTISAYIYSTLPDSVQNGLLSRSPSVGPTGSALQKQFGYISSCSLSPGSGMSCY